MRWIILASAVWGAMLSVATCFYIDPLCISLAGVFVFLAVGSLIPAAIVCCGLRLAFGVLLFGLFVSAPAVFNIPYRLFHFVAANRLESVVTQVEAADPPKIPFRVGVFRVVGVEKTNNNVHLWLDDDPAGRTGLLCVRNETPFDDCYWTQIPLDRRWRLVVED